MSEGLFAGRPGFDPEAAAILAAAPPFPPLSTDTLQAMRDSSVADSEGVREASAARGIIYEECTITGPRGEIEISTIRPAAQLNGAPIYFVIHGGGMVMGNRFITLTLFEELD